MSERGKETDAAVLDAYATSVEHYRDVGTRMGEEFAPFLRRIAERLRGAPVVAEAHLVRELRALMEDMQAERISTAKAVELFLAFARQHGSIPPASSAPEETGGAREPDRALVEGCLERLYEDARNDLPTCDWISSLAQRAFAAREWEPFVRNLAQTRYPKLHELADLLAASPPRPEGFTVTEAMVREARIAAGHRVFATPEDAAELASDEAAYRFTNRAIAEHITAALSSASDRGAR